MTPHNLFDEWLSTERKDQPTLFGDAPAPPRDCARAGHLYTETMTTWPDETFERMTWTCTACGDVRGRC